MDDLTEQSAGYYYPTTFKMFVPTRQGMYSTNNKKLVCDIIGNPTNYPQEWKEKGIIGNPFLVSESGLSMLPSDAVDTNNWATGDNIGLYNGDNYGFYWKSSRKDISAKLMLVKAKDGSWVKYTLGDNWGTDLGCEAGSRVDNHVYTSLTDNDLTTLGYTDRDDAKQNIVFMYFYETRANSTSPSSNMSVESIGLGLAAAGGFTETGVYQISDLTNKIAISGFISSGNGYSSIVNFRVNNLELDYYTPRLGRLRSSSMSNSVQPHGVISGFKTTSKTPAVKILPYLTKYNSRAQINMIFKEMIWDNNKDTLGDTGFGEVVVDSNSFTYTKGNVYRLKGNAGALLDEDIQALTGFTWSEDQINQMFIDKDGNIRDNVTGGLSSAIKLWDGNGWGDNDKFRIIDNVSTMLDDNDQTILYGQKAIKLPNFLD